MFLKQHNGGIKMDKTGKKYTSSLFYEVFLTGKYIKKMGENIFKKHGILLTPEEFSTLDHIFENNAKICQRDLALKMLINRANMGKILSKLEEEGYISINLSTKGNRPVKLVHLTKKGEEFYLSTIEKFKNHSQLAVDKITIKETENTIETLQKIREALQEMIAIDI